METLVTTVHFVVALLMIGLILLQQGKGASMGVSMGGGGSNTVFGSSGGATFFGKLTALLALIFFISSLSLAFISRDNAQIDADTILPLGELETVVPAESGSATEAAPTLPINDALDEPLTLPIESSAPLEDSVESATPTE